VANTTGFKARVEYEVTDGTQTTYTFPFSYLRKKFVMVSILHSDATETALEYGVDYTVNNLSVSLTTPAQVGEHIIIYRQTSTDKIVTWNDGSILLAQDMNTEDAQMLHLQEEQQDYIMAHAISTKVTSDKEVLWDALNHRVINISDPQDPQDAVTKNYMENVQGSFVTANTKILNDTKQTQSNAQVNENLSKAWAVSTGSPDGAEDTQSSTGKTQSSRTWALYAEDSAKDSATSADESKKWSEVAKTNAIGDHVFIGATDSTDGDTGLVPLPKAGEQGKFLKGNRSWVQIEPLIIAINPVAYYRDVVWSGYKTTLVTPNKLSVNIGGQGYLMNTQHSLSINDSANWDKASFATPANRKGKDFYIYVCQGANYIPKIVLSNNSTVPENYTALTSRKIGGFHCECADVGAISNHPLSGYVAGDILPASVWDLHHRPISAPEGMVFTGRIWVDIYLPSWDGAKLVSEYNNVICDGASAYPLTGTGFAETFAKINKRLLSYDEMSAVVKGSEEGVNIKNSADPNTTGGHVSTTGRRMISDIGCEDCAGVSWQWLSDLFGRDLKSEWVTNESTINTNVGYTGVSEPNRGSVWGGSLGRMLLGGDWGVGSHCGSRSAGVINLASYGNGLISARGASEPLIRKT
jgi:hypothetical protein